MWPVVAIVPGVGRSFGSSTAGYVDQQGIVDGLATGVIGIQRPAHRFVRLQLSARLLLSVAYPKGQVRGIVIASKRVGIFS